MITLQENYPVDRIGQEEHDNVEEHNRVMSNLKLLVQSMLENGKDADYQYKTVSNADVKWAQDVLGNKDS